MILPKMIKEKLTLDVKSIMLDLYQSTGMTCSAFISQTITEDQFKDQISNKIDQSSKEIVALVENIGK